LFASCGAALEHVPIMQNAVEHSADSRYVAEQFSPVFDWAVRWSFENLKPSTR
jgi:hypothetical protein